MPIMYEYNNGNTAVKLYTDGTKIRTFKDKSIPLFPESIDVKVTDYCDAYCFFCHERSSVDGNHCDTELLIDQLRDLPAGVELAIGGGNPLSHPKLKPFLEKCKSLGFVCNLTVNVSHLGRFMKDILYYVQSGLIHGLGISVIYSDIYKHREDLLLARSFSPNVVYHIIAGIGALRIIGAITDIVSKDAKILILGYKQQKVGYSPTCEGMIRDRQEAWKRCIAKYIRNTQLSFDNLAIKDLDVQRFFTEEGWNTLYMGDDFTCSMFIDAVKQEYAKTSTSTNRKDWNEIKLVDFFKDK